MQRVWLVFFLVVSTILGQNSNTAKIYLDPLVKEVRGLLVVYNGPEKPSTTDRSFCQTWQLGYVTEKHGGPVPTRETLGRLGKQIGHSYLGNVPMLALGLSASASSSWRSAKREPERTIAAAPICISHGDAESNPKSLKTPVFAIMSEGDFVEQSVQAVFRNRRNGAQWATSIRWNEFHKVTDARNIAFPFFEQVIKSRLPRDWDPKKGPVQLRNLKEAQGWLGVRDRTYKSSFPTIGPADGIHRGKNNIMWFPNRYVAHSWRAFRLYHDGLVDPASGRYWPEPKVASVRTATPGSRNQPTAIEYHQPYPVTIASQGSPDRVEIWDGDILLHLDLRPNSSTRMMLSGAGEGFYALHGQAHFPDGRVVLSQMHTLLVKPHAKGWRLELFVDDGNQRRKAGELVQLKTKLRTDEKVSRVQFYAGDGLIGESKTPDFSLSWRIPSGMHRLWARAFLENGDSLTARAFRLDGHMPSTPARLEISPIRATLKPGSVQDFQARVFDQYGSEMEHSEVKLSLEGQGELRDNRFQASGGNHYQSRVTAKLGELSHTAVVQVDPVIRINFQAPWAYTPAGFLADKGESFGDRGNGLRYGWDSPPRTNIVIRPGEKGVAPEYLTFISMHIQRNIHKRPQGLPGEYTNDSWELELANGEYSVRLVAGDIDNVDAGVAPSLPEVIPDKIVYKMSLEEKTVLEGRPTLQRPWILAEGRVVVSDGRLSLANVEGQYHNKINFIEIAEVGKLPPLLHSLPTVSPVRIGKRTNHPAGSPLQRGKWYPSSPKIQLLLGTRSYDPSGRQTQ